MSDVTSILERLAAGDGSVAAELLPLVYEELRRLAKSRLAIERPGQTLQTTALVHEAWLRVAGERNADARWNGRGHFFAAAAEAMRRILVENARRKRREKHGGDRLREDVEFPDIEAPEPREDLIALDSALDKLRLEDPAAADLVQLRYFAGLTMAECAESMDISPRTADRIWVFAKAWLHRELA